MVAIQKVQEPYFQNWRRKVQFLGNYIFGSGLNKYSTRSAMTIEHTTVTNMGLRRTPEQAQEGTVGCWSRMEDGISVFR